MESAVREKTLILFFLQCALELRCDPSEIKVLSLFHQLTLDLRFTLPHAKTTLEQAGSDRLHSKTSSFLSVFVAIN